MLWGKINRWHRSFSDNPNSNKEKWRINPYLQQKVANRTYNVFFFPLNTQAPLQWSMAVVWPTEMSKCFQDVSFLGLSHKIPPCIIFTCFPICQSDAEVPAKDWDAKRWRSLSLSDYVKHNPNPSVPSTECYWRDN